MNPISKLTVLFIFLFLTGIRIQYAKWDTPTVTNVLTWDAFGYYLPLPSTWIYHDYKKMDWVDGVIEKYQTTGNLYQLHELPNGNRVMKYFLGISFMYSPFFLVGDMAAGVLNYPHDGFSAPYQLAISFAALLYSLLGLWVLRWVLLKFFKDRVVAITLLLLALATNYVQYVAVDSGQTHGYIFTLYALLLAATIKWHEEPLRKWAFYIGAIIGLGVLCRPTEAVMIFIPLLYNLHNKNANQAKWAMLKANRKHLYIAIASGILCFSPQLIYWKLVTGHWIYDVGSKFDFFKPHWQVLFGWEKGWFIYTPIVMLMVAGLFFLKKNPFRLSAIYFFIINTWIVIAWSDWHYGASYSARALVQSYAVLSIPLAIMVDKLTFKIPKWKFPALLILLIILISLIALNLFQVWQYNKTILHYHDNNRRYYQAIFLNPSPTPLQMSLLDTKEFIRHEKKYSTVSSFQQDSVFLINANKNSVVLFQKNLTELFPNEIKIDRWLKISCEVKSPWGAFDSFLSTTLDYDGKKKETHVRMQNGISKENAWNLIEYYFKIPNEANDGQIIVEAKTALNADILLKNAKVIALLGSKQ